MSPFAVEITSPNSDANPVVIPITGGSMTWAASAEGTINVEAFSADLLDAGLLPPRRLGGRRIRWAGNTDLGEWRGIITAPVARSDGTTELVAHTREWVLNARRTPKVSDTGMANPGAVIKRHVEDRYRASHPIGLDITNEEVGPAIPSIQRATDLGSLLRTTVRQTGVEYRVDHEAGRLDLRNRVGRDKSGEVALIEGAAIVDWEYAFDLEALFNEVQVAPVLSPYDRTRTIVVRDEASIRQRGLRQTAVAVPGLVTRAALRSIGYAILKRLKGQGDSLGITIANRNRVFASIREGDSIEVRIPSINLRCRYRAMVRHYDLETGLLSLSGDIEAEPLA